LNSSLAQSAAKSWLAKICPEKANHTLRGTFAFLPKFEFLSHDSDSSFARKPIKGPEDSDDYLASKKILEPRMTLWFGAQDKTNLAKKAQTWPNCDVTHKKTQNDNFFKSKLENLPNLQMI